MNHEPDLVVRPGAGHSATLLAFGAEYRCAIGRAGVRADKHEGDGATPVGTFALRRAFFRPDRYAAPDCALPVRALDPDDGWCDDPGDAAYNRLVRRPYPASHEAMWRCDALYDLIVVPGHNDDPPVSGAGSAIFIHCAGPQWAPTEGCVALAPGDLLSLMALLETGSRLIVEG